MQQCRDDIIPEFRQYGYAGYDSTASVAPSSLHCAVQTINNNKQIALTIPLCGSENVGTRRRDNGSKRTSKRRTASHQHRPQSDIRAQKPLLIVRVEGPRVHHDGS